LHVSILGPVEVRRDDGAVTVPGGKAGELLVRLALDAGAVVRTDRLLEELWADDAVHTTRNTLQSKVARLRRALGQPSPVVGRDGGYALDVDPFAIDAHRVLRDATDAADLLGAGDPAAAALAAATALGLYRGDVLPSVTGAWADPHRARLEEARSSLLHTRFSAKLQLGAIAEVIGGLEAVIDQHPFEEELWALLIAALYRAGRQADALTAYQRVRGELAEQLGLEPGPTLRDLERQILAQDPRLATSSDAAATTRSNLPSLAVVLIGRETELAQVTASIAESRLVEVVGVGGIGKTALAIEVGRRLLESDPQEGVWLIRLDEASSANEATDAVIAALGVTGGDDALIERLRLGRTTLILDNCEHLVDAAAALAGRLLDAALGVRVLATSQVPLGVDGEVVFEIDPLPLDAAVELFGRRAKSHGREVTSDGGDVEDLCRSLDGLPLAIELAAARTKTLSVPDILRRLDDRFTVLSDPTSRRPERRRALRSTIAWSYELLFPDDQRGLWALATFSGGAPLDAVEHVLASLDVPAGIDVFGRLASRSLLSVEEDRHGRLRYRVLDSIRAFALDAARDAGHEEQAHAAHAHWFATAAASSTAGVRSAAQAEHLDLVRTERANIDAALGWAVTNDPTLGLDIANGFGWAWIVLGDSRGADRLVSALSVAKDEARASERAAALLLAGWIEASTGDLSKARDHVQAATTIAEETADDELRAQCSYYLAYVVSHEGRWQEALELTDRSAQLLDPLDRPWHQAANALFAARAAISAGDVARSTQACEQVERWLERVEDPWLQVRGEAIRGELARLERRFPDAVEHLGRAAASSDRLGFRQTAAYQLSSLGRAQLQTGDYPAGIATLSESIDKAEATGDTRLAALMRVHLGRARRSMGDDEGARDALEAAARWHDEVGGGEQAALGECLLAALDAANKDPDASERLRRTLEDARRRDDPPVEVFALDALARIAVEAGDLDTARRLCAEGDERMEAAAHFISDLDRVDARAVRSTAST
jgi:predicted ATPase/DNA-binding SARP family transcriptional activator